MMTTINIPELILQFGMAGAVVACLVLFLHYLAEERKDRTAERIAAGEERTRFLDVLEQYRKTVDIVVERCTGQRTGQ
jgi:hypothetical protein